jgi:hypothetical protein
MKYSALLFTWLIVCAVCAYGLTPSDLAANNRIQLVASDLVRQEKMPEARNYIEANLHVDGSRDSRLIETAQQWINMALYFKNRREGSCATTAAQESISVASELSNGAALKEEKANLLCNLGIVCEKVLFDATQAATFYDAALALDSSNKLAQEHRMQLKRKGGR